MQKYIVIILISLVALSCGDNVGSKYRAEKGVLDISNQSINDIKSINLDEGWEFYWNKLIAPSDFTNIKEAPQYVTIPNVWGDILSNDSETGFATYRLVINANKQDSIFGLMINRINTAYCLWVNNELITRVGDLGQTAENHKHSWKENVETIHSNTQKIEIVIQVSNFEYIDGGIVRPLKLISKTYINKVSKTSNGINFLLIGFLIVVTIYHLVLYFRRINMSSSLSLSLLALLVGIMLMVSKDCSFLYLIFPDIAWGVHYRLGVIFFILSQFMLFLHVFSSFKTEFPQKSKYLISSFLVLMLIMAIFVPVGIFSNIYEYIKWSFVLIVIFLAYVTYKAIVNEITNSRLTFIGIGVVFISFIYDFIKNKYGIYSVDIIPFGIIIYIVMQVYLTLSHFLESLTYTEQLTEEMDFINNNLEKLIQERTNKVEQQKEELQMQSVNLQMANDEIVKINRELNSKGNEINKKNRSLTDSLNYAKRLQTAVLPDPKYLKEVLPEHFIFFQPKDIVSGDFYWYGEVDSSWDFDDASSTQVLIAADCTGHGVPGAFMTLLGHNFLHLTVNIQEVTDPEQIIYKLDHQVVETLRQKDPNSIKDGMDIAVLTIEQEKNIISYSGAGNPLYYFSEGEFHEIKGSSFGIGGILRKEKIFTPHKIEYKSGDIFYIFTDGYCDQIGGDEGRKFYKKRLKELLTEIHSYPISEQERIINKNFHDWKGDYKQIDDVLFIGIRMP